MQDIDHGPDGGGACAVLDCSAPIFARDHELSILTVYLTYGLISHEADNIQPFHIVHNSRSN